MKRESEREAVECKRYRVVWRNTARCVRNNYEDEGSCSLRLFTREKGMVEVGFHPFRGIREVMGVPRIRTLSFALLPRNALPHAGTDRARAECE